MLQLGMDLELDRTANQSILTIIVSKLSQFGERKYKLFSLVTTLLSPNKSLFGAPSLFTCEALCDGSLLLAWLINETFLSHRENVFSSLTRSNYFQQCGSNGSNTYTEILEVVATERVAPFTVQCVGLCVCGEDSKVTNCSARTLYSPAIHVEGAKK